MREGLRASRKICRLSFGIFLSGVSTNALLKNHDGRAIINALKDEKGSYIHSLKAPWLPELIEKHEKILALKKEKATLTKTPSKSILPSTRPRFTKKNTLDLLREIDGDESESNSR